MSSLPQDLETALREYDVADATIAEWREEFLALRIDDLDSKEQLQAVHAARMVVKEARVKVEKTRKALKADALEWGRKVDAEAKRITALLEPIEQHLLAEEDKPAAEQRRLEALAEERRLAELRQRMELLRDAGSAALEQDIARLDEEEFALFLAREQERKAAREAEEAERRAAEELRLAEERKRLEAERAEQERLRAQQEAEAAVRRKEEQEALERERAAQEAEREKLAAERRAMEEERARVEAERQRQAEEEAARQRAADEKARQEAIEAARVEAERLAAERAPDREKVEAYALAVYYHPIPDVWCKEAIVEARSVFLERLQALTESAS